jgi:hypothetical protein
MAEKQHSSGKGFGLFNKMMQNMFPNSAANAKDDIDPTPEQMDNIIKYQLTLAHPWYLDPETIYIAGIVDERSIAAQVHRQLVKNHFVLEAPKTKDPPDSAAATPMTVDTFKIDKHFQNKVPTISIHAARKLVALLFFWEEEVNRWRKLDQEEAEVRALLETATEQHAVEDLNVALESVLMRKKMLPSQRAEGASTVFPPKQEALPSYDEGGRSNQAS